uniref:RRM domain-containing protein n=1 Tax=Monopterus albus TaxID=43700 RepID=A0A3Q3QHA1_MONAL|nr:RNA-binding protein 43 isoform X2 [Monopterus albus]
METGRWDQSRTVVVSGVPEVLDVCRMIDKLTIHFQSRRRSDGGDVEAVTYPTNIKGVAFIAFDKAEDADRVVQKEQQIMTDSKFPEDYLLTVFPFTRDVFLYVVSATVDLFVFRSDLESLIQSLRSAHRSLRFQLLFRQRKATIEGPFAAIKALREDLMHRANQLKSTVPTAAIKLRESPLNPRVISHHGFVGSGSCSLSSLLRSTDEATEVQSLLSNAKTQNSARQKVGSFISTDSDKEELRAQLKVPSVKASPRTVLWEISAGIRPSLSDPDLLPAEKIASSQPEVDDISQDTISATKTWAGNHLGSRYSSSDNLTESHHSSSTKFLNTRLKDDLMSSECDAEYTEDLSADCSANPDISHPRRPRGSSRPWKT